MKTHSQSIALYSALITSMLLAACSSDKKIDVELEDTPTNNLGFELNWQDWRHAGDVSISNQAYQHNLSAKISQASGYFETDISVDKNSDYQLSAFTKGHSKIGIKLDNENGESQAQYSVKNGSDNWQRQTLQFNSQNSSKVTVYAAYQDGEAWYDAFELKKISPPADTTACQQRYSLPIQSATSNSQYTNYSAELAIDDNLSDTSRWSVSDTPQYLMLDLGEISVTQSISTYWYNAESLTTRFDLVTSENGQDWYSHLTNENASPSSAFQTLEITTHKARYVKLIIQETSSIQDNGIVEFKLYGCNSSGQTTTDFALNPNLPPSGNFDLLDWTISVPIDEDGNGRSDHIKEQELANGYTHPDYFFTAEDGGMVFKATVSGYKTSTNTSYTRSELREMLRRGDTQIDTQGISKNNWGFSTYSENAKQQYGGIDGTLTATLKVDHVTTTGEDYQIGRVIIGQIHAADDEPARLYYRKLPNNNKGSIYLAHEIRGGDDLYFEMLGSRSNTASDPTDGIALGEVFSYKIQVSGHDLTVTIMREGKPDVVQKVDMSNSGYHLADDEYMYFKAGAYNQNNSGDDFDYVQTTFYQLHNSHTGYDY
ncbi:polysaccharide lyase family 7 protein [Catenovulum sediminis]|uniref:Polysaccharide lyase family 7 protein n=1 Tax=Catenovulum sediminis TaxID=1740262 RepID=A0ABV1RED2_9ALTE|nr:polysaccharide lyase family 7 protein [Catenovulum sediminis]